MAARLLPDPAIVDLFTLVAAPFWGSFLALLVARWPRGEPVAFARSRCRRCDRPLTPRELVPILSWLVQGGRCRGCGAAIGVEPLVFELSALAIAIQAIGLAGLHGPAALLVTAAGGLLLAVSVIDARHLLIPDGAVLALGALGLIETVVTPAGPDATDRLIGLAGGWLALVAVEHGYRRLRGREGLGRGDAKLFAAAGAWLGWQALPVVLLLASLAALVFVLLRAAREGRLPEGGRALAFGPFLAAALWVVLLVERAAPPAFLARFFGSPLF